MRVVASPDFFALTKTYWIAFAWAKAYVIPAAFGIAAAAPTLASAVPATARLMGQGRVYLRYVLPASSAWITAKILNWTQPANYSVSQLYFWGNVAKLVVCTSMPEDYDP